jgi:hypothetical protein
VDWPLAELSFDPVDWPLVELSFDPVDWPLAKASSLELQLQPSSELAEVFWEQLWEGALSAPWGAAWILPLDLSLMLV